MKENYMLISIMTYYNEDFVLDSKFDMLLQTKNFFHVISKTRTTQL